MKLKMICAVAASLLSAAPAFSATVTLDFAGVGSLQSIADYYNGGTSSDGASGTNYGIHFGGDAVGLVNDQYTSYYSNAPSPGGVMSAIGADAALNSASGFTSQVSFWYSAAESATVSIFSGLNGSGDLLGTFNLAANAQQNGCSDTPYCFWSLTSLDFSGVAHSIQFGSATGAGFDNLTLSTVPLPAAGWLMLSALGGLGALSRRKQTA